MTTSSEIELKKHRDSLPFPQKKQTDISLWSVLRQCIGQDLSRITMPVVFNEPLSFLQRMSEFMEYSWLLDKADAASDSLERLQYVTAFAVSGLASNWERLGKPFNPLLGETFELQRDNYRMVCEQVSHHPPISAFNAESINWNFHGTIHPKLKLHGKYIEIQPKGVLTLTLKTPGEAYTWSNVNCYVHNIIVGKMWIEQHGIMEIIGHTSGLKSVLTFREASRHSKELNRIEGFIMDENKVKQSFIFGKWNEFVKVASMLSYTEFVKENAEKFDDVRKPSRLRGNSTAGIGEEKVGKGRTSSRNVLSKFNSLAASFKSSLDLESGVNCYEVPPGETNECSLMAIDSSYFVDIPDAKLLWEVYERHSNSPQFYHFTSFAMMLNEIDPIMRDKLASTDSRLRPDIRLLEEGEIDKASKEKTRLEEKQRQTRKFLKKEKLEEEQSKWFTFGHNPFTMQEDWLYSGQYWDGKFNSLPDIF